MSDPKHPVRAEVDPSEGAIEEHSEQQRIQAADDEGENSARLEVDPSEGPAE